MRLSLFLPFLLLPLLRACVVDDEADPSVSAELPRLLVPETLAQAEGSGDDYALDLVLQLAEASQTTVSLRYRTEAETATADDDYVSVDSKVVRLLPGETEKTVRLDIRPDGNAEPDESFRVVFFDVRNAIANRNSTTVTLLNDDAADANPFGIPQGGYQSAESYDGMRLVWEEQFSGGALSQADWNYEIGTGSNGWGNNELQYYQPDNTYLSQGHLVIEARKEPTNGQPYSSSRLTTMDKHEFRYGRIDVRAALPEGQGIWPAVWMLGADFQQVGWPSCGEIDIMEMVGHEPGKVHGTAHYGQSGQSHFYKGESTTLPGGEKFSQEFHVFSIDWQANKITWLLDDVPFFTLHSYDTGGQAWRFNKEFFFIVNLAVGGNWPGYPDATTEFPQRLFVDYIRVFQEN